LLLQENPQLREKVDSKNTQKLARTILLDLIVSFLQQKNRATQASISVQNVLKLLSTKLKTNNLNNFEYIIGHCQRLGLVKLEIELLIDLNTQR